MIRKLLFATLCLIDPGAALAVCPEKPMSICEIVRMNSFVAHVRVSSTQHLHDEDDPEGLAGWLYHFDVVRSYRDRSISKAAAYSVNTTARLVLKTGKEYIVFAGKDGEGILETGNYCDPYTEMEFTSELEQQVMACIASEKTAKNPNKAFQPTPSARLN